MTAYYNEFDPKAAAWLRELIAEGLIAPGEVDERSIADVRPDDLRGFRQCHFFAGIGGWSYALRLAGWPDDRPVWTGSCPCQPFSAAGKREGFNDPRHLWPEFRRLIREHRPHRIFGEQVSSALAWLDLICGDLEGEGYAVGSAIVGAHSVGAPHIRQRLYWVADVQRGTAERWGHDVAGAAGRVEGEARERERVRTDAGAGIPALGMADDHGPRCGPGRAGETGDGRGATRVESPGLRAAGGLGHPDEPGPQGRGERGDGPGERAAGAPGVAGGTVGHTASGGCGVGGDATQSGRGGHADGAERSFWSDAVWLPCRDGKARPTQPGLFPLAHGVSGRVGLLRGAGNAIVPQVAAAFIEAYCEVTA